MRTVGFKICGRRSSATRAFPAPFDHESTDRSRRHPFPPRDRAELARSHAHGGVPTGALPKSPTPVTEIDAINMRQTKLRARRSTEEISHQGFGREGAQSTARCGSAAAPALRQKINLAPLPDSPRQVYEQLHHAPGRLHNPATRPGRLGERLPRSAERGPLGSHGKGGDRFG
jgi:hypothetical protein